MKKYLFFIGIVCGMWVPSVTHAVEHITLFQSDITVNTDRSVDVVETIVYDFDTNQKHGIYRTIPITYKTSWLPITKGFDVVSVTDERNIPYDVTTSKSNGAVTIKIGDADTLISGVHTYVIQYRMDDVIQFFDTYDMLSWNVTGNYWDVPMNTVRAFIHFSESVEDRQVTSHCYRGSFGSTQSCAMSSSQTIDAENLIRGEGITIDIQFPKGIVYQPTPQENMYAYILLGLKLCLFPVMVGIALFYVWYRRGRDPKGRGTIITQFAPPEGLTPLEVGIIMDEKIQQRDISAILISLAVQGYLKITRIPSKLMGTKDYEFSLLKDKNLVPDTIEREILGNLFEGDKTIVSLKKDLKYVFAETLQKTKFKAYKQIKQQGYFTMNPYNVRIGGIIGGVMLIFLGIFVFSNSIILFINISLCGLLVLLFVPFLSALTQKGMEIKEYVRGFKTYLMVAEKDRLAFHNAPEKNPALFEKMLPYAIVLGVEKQWASQFDGLFQLQPTWYSDPAHTVFVPSVLTSDLGTFSKTAYSSLATSKSSGGGGSSGGGFGGGGGGSW